MAKPACRLARELPLLLLQHALLLLQHEVYRGGQVPALQCGPVTHKRDMNTKLVMSSDKSIMPATAQPKGHYADWHEAACHFKFSC